MTGLTVYLLLNGEGRGRLSVKKAVQRISTERESIWKCVPLTKFFFFYNFIFLLTLKLPKKKQTEKKEFFCVVCISFLCFFRRLTEAGWCCTCVAAPCRWPHSSLSSLPVTLSQRMHISHTSPHTEIEKQKL